MSPHLSTQENLSLFVELSEPEMGATTGGAISASFLNRWAAKARSGNLNISRLSQRLVNEFHKGGLNSESAANWASSTAQFNDVITWQKAIAPLVGGYLASGAAIAGVNSAANSTVITYLNIVSIPRIPIL